MDLLVVYLQVYAKGNQYAVDPAHFLRRIAQLPMGADFCDGGQHDAQELFRLLLDGLHHDLVSLPLYLLALHHYSTACISEAGLLL